MMTDAADAAGAVPPMMVRICSSARSSRQSLEKGITGGGGYGGGGSVDAAAAAAAAAAGGECGGGGGGGGDMPDISHSFRPKHTITLMMKDGLGNLEGRGRGRGGMKRGREGGEASCLSMSSSI
jgi:hypothetical protein